MNTVRKNTEDLRQHFTEEEAEWVSRAEYMQVKKGINPIARQRYQEIKEEILREVSERVYWLIE